ncbi:MerR family transcriptional regulator [Bacillus horti]|uniref:DNA-binding transcriptional MerR regulator n=1 Tax=Caldalkalibacillus horti TaxID=77523 RepID=A0ABT9W2F5_9BACI|nr:MerR family transcriptional regulator [Bacillus horti]MDQ0167300.1 DNA-binding transcriptional MerR regulator [Bacillus horti]
MYTIKQASDLLGIPAVTIRAWETRYGVVSPVRTESGYRMFTEENIEDLRWLKSQIEDQSLNISQAARLLEQRRKKQNDTTDVSESIDDEGEGDGFQVRERMVERLYEALSNYRTDQAKTIVELGFSMFGYDAMLKDVMFPILIRVGDDWENGKATVFQEHYTTQFLVQKCLSFFHIFPTDPELPQVLALCPPGEQHQAGLLMFSLFLRKKGVDVLYLGADTPFEGIDKLIRSQQIRFVCISVSILSCLPQGEAFVEGLLKEFPDIQFALGGSAFEHTSGKYGPWLLSSDTRDWQKWFDDIYLAKA